MSNNPNAHRPPRAYLLCVLGYLRRVIGVVMPLNKCHAHTPATRTQSLLCLLSVKHRLLGERYDRQEKCPGDWLATNTHRFL